MLKQKNKKVYVLGTDKIGWSIDKDRMYTIKAIDSIESYEVTNSFFKADIIYVVWWNQLFTLKFRILNILFNKELIVCITNDLKHQKSAIKRVFSIVDKYVYSNSKQKDFLLENGIEQHKLYFNPFYVDENIFKKLDISYQEICVKYGINQNKIKNKVVIGSFQRDSLGADLKEAKWQKNPKLLVDIMNKLDKSKFVLLLAGPRRHYIINLCKKHNIQYIYVGQESYIDNQKDDLRINALNIEDMPYLYNLIDLYIVSSKSEGGPKAIPESILCSTKVISTDVGFASDLLDKQYVYDTVEDAVKIINKIIDENVYSNTKIKKYYSFELYKNRIQKILKGAR